ncbi:hypothetical protein P5G51_008575 [Virgibacillus sp. 179-BFC.A HS]|uniref:SPOR domain-containing protein n=1 Tax=Tigheibacillus jepli TaxID=3035914 RepID=A0ABU5CIW6_9BACI|nr:hypothetical protein [Virgibacillus sp. 179-BFC.A HS]MDY0405445.1 hypothetical protein [Virgibacillus sp. 179-BFC.A HS]
MEKRRPIIVHLNEEKVPIKQDTDRGQSFKRDHHPTVKINRPNSARKKSPEKKIPPFLKKILFAMFSAVGIGLLLGFIMLHLFGNMESSGPTSQQVPVNHLKNQPNTNQADQQMKGAGNAEEKTLAGLQAFVLQGGIFSESANAENTARGFASAGYPSFIWEQDGQFFLLVGIEDSKNAAVQAAKKMKENNFDVYAKEWQVAKRKLPLNKEESEWLAAFANVWNSAVKQMSMQGKVDASEWKELAEMSPQKSQVLEKMQQEAAALAKQNASAGKGEIQMQLLRIWYDYGQLNKE